MPPDQAEQRCTEAMHITTSGERQHIKQCSAITLFSASLLPTLLPATLTLLGCGCCGTCRTNPPGSMLHKKAIQEVVKALVRICHSCYISQQQIPLHAASGLTHPSCHAPQKHYLGSRDTQAACMQQDRQTQLQPGLRCAIGRLPWWRLKPCCRRRPGCCRIKRLLVGGAADAAGPAGHRQGRARSSTL
jgi:hypothetical protein